VLECRPRGERNNGSYQNTVSVYAAILSGLLALLLTVLMGAQPCHWRFAYLYVLIFQILAWHATWHIVGAFGFIVLWPFNHMRFVINPPGRLCIDA
jgi:hypothetical protein